jgi:DNA-binding response OmpR family regulator
LYIEDDDANVRLVERLLARQGDIELISATHGLAGIDVARDRQPVLVLLDLGLPDISGEIVLKCLRGNPATAAIPVVIVSGDVTDRRVQRLLESGASAYFSKPVEVRKLLATVDELIRERSAPQRAPADGSEVRVLATDETDQWLAPMFQAMTSHRGRALGTLIGAAITDGALDWIELGRLMREELGWNDYPAYPTPPNDTK